MTPFFSIIVPVYNVAPYLRECLDSVLAQTFADWEVICVDDGSMDGSGAILDEYAKKDKRFTVIHQPNAGVGSARNAALDVANGAWVVFLDGDDIWSEKLLAVVTKMIGEHPSAQLFRFGFYCFEGAKEVAAQSERTFDCKVIDISREISMDDFFGYLFWCFAYSKDLIGQIRFPTYARGEDRCFLYQIMLERANVIVATPQPLYGYRTRPGSAMNSTPSAQVLLDEMDHRLDIMEMIDKGGKRVDYAGDWWLEKYFTTKFYRIINARKDDRREVVSDWRHRLRRLRWMKGLSSYGRFVAWTCSLIRLRVWDALVIDVIPRWRKDCSSIPWRALAWHGVVLGVKSILPKRVYRWVHRRLKGESE